MHGDGIRGLIHLFHLGRRDALVGDTHGPSNNLGASRGRRIRLLLLVALRSRVEIHYEDLAIWVILRVTFSSVTLVERLSLCRLLVGWGLEKCDVLHVSRLVLLYLAIVEVLALGTRSTLVILSL